MWTLDHPTRRQTGTKNVVKIIKNKEIPSIPNCIFIFKYDNQETSSTNWNCPHELSNWTHKKRDNKNTSKERLKENVRIKYVWEDGTHNRIRHPKMGRDNNVESNKFIFEVFFLKS